MDTDIDGLDQLMEYCEENLLQLNLYYADHAAPGLYGRDIECCAALSQVYATMNQSPFTLVPSYLPFKGTQPTKALIIVHNKQVHHDEVLRV
jgi:hypothetical protein